VRYTKETPLDRSSRDALDTLGLNVDTLHSLNIFVDYSLAPHIGVGFRVFYSFGLMGG
jgi:hypothetical protein